MGDPTTARRSALQHAERLRALTETERDMIRLVNRDGFGRWLEQIQNIDGCTHPIYLAGRTTVRAKQTGVVLHHYDTHSSEPGGVLAVRCRNRRHSVCPPCSRLHAGDTYQLVRAGLQGGKGAPATVAEHPRLFTTLTAPSFGAVHSRDATGRRCRPRRDAGNCEHGRPLGCGIRHSENDPLLGQPICADCYDYPAHVLWHAHVGELWARTVRTIRRHLASTAGITQTDFRNHARLSFAKVAEYQRRGAVHFHAVIRLDGPDGPDTAPPDWATASLLEDVIRNAVATVSASPPYSTGLGEYVCRWGTQLDVHSIKESIKDELITPDAVAAYIGKYISKSVGDAGGTDRPIKSQREIDFRKVNRHLRTLMYTCWRFGELPELQNLKLQKWTHTLGFRGHCLSKSRRYSTTYWALRDGRTNYLRGALLFRDNVETVTESFWHYAWSGYTDGESTLATGIAHDIAQSRQLTREVLADFDGRWPDDATD
jgi:hypothetical protein